MNKPVKAPGSQLSNRTGNQRSAITASGAAGGERIQKEANALGQQEWMKQDRAQPGEIAQQRSPR